MNYADIKAGGEYLWTRPETSGKRQSGAKVKVLEIGSVVVRTQCGGKEKTAMGTAFPIPTAEDVRVLIETQDGEKISVKAGDLSPLE